MMIPHDDFLFLFRLLPSGKCSSVIHSSFLDKVDLGGYKWGTLSEETIEFYWEEFQV